MRRGPGRQAAVSLPARDLGFLLVIAAGSIAAIGYRFGLGDHAVYIPLVRHVLDPGYLQNDWWVTSWGGLHGLFVRSLALLTRLIGIEQASFLLHVAERVGLVIATFLLSVRLFRHRPAAFLAVLFVVFSVDWNLGGNPTVLSHSIPHTLALVPAVLALLAWLDGRLPQTALWLGLATLTHVLIGLELALVLAVAEIVRQRGPYLRALGAGVLYATVSSPVLAPLLAGQLGGRGEALSDREYVRIVGEIRAPWHYLPSTWSWEIYAVFAIFFGAAVAAWALMRRDADAEGTRLLEAAVATILTLCLIGTVFVEWIPSALVLKLQFFRLMVILKVIASLYLARAVARAADTGHPLHIALAGVTVLGIGNPIHFGAAFILFILVAGGASFRAHPLAAGGGLAVTVAGVVSLVTLRGAAWLTPSEAMTLLAVAGGLAGIQAVARRWHPAPPQTIGLAAGVLAMVFATRYLPLNVVWSAVPRGLVANIEVRPRADEPQELLGQWIREHTEAQAVLITPPYLEGFRTWAERAIVVDFKSFAFEDAGAETWLARVEDLMSGSRFTKGGDRIAEMRRGYAALTERDYRRLGAKYHAAYAVVPASSRLSFPSIHRGSGFVVYRIGDDTR